MKMNDPTTILFSWALPAPLFNRCIKSEILLHTLFLEHHPIKIAHLSYSNSIGSQFINESNTKPLACVTTQSQVLRPLVFVNY